MEFLKQLLGAAIKQLTRFEHQFSSVVAREECHTCRMPRVASFRCFTVTLM